MGQSTVQMLRQARTSKKPIQRGDGRWVLEDVCAAAFAVALDHVLVGLENDPVKQDKHI
jgi:hypothetical protein